MLADYMVKITQKPLELTPMDFALPDDDTTFRNPIHISLTSTIMKNARASSKNKHANVNNSIKCVVKGLMNIQRVWIVLKSNCRVTVWEGNFAPNLRYPKISPCYPLENN